MQKNVARIFCAELEGIKARLIEVEIDLNVGLHAFNIVGLADRALNEAKERVNSALKNSGVRPPTRENRKITINLAPADIKKTGSQYDLAIAVGFMLATGQMKTFDPQKILIIGELSLDGRVRPVNGALNIAQMALENNFEKLILPRDNAAEASVIEGIKIIPVETLLGAVHYLENTKYIEAEKFKPADYRNSSVPDFSEIKGQEHAKRALIIAASGGHNLLMSGPPGVGKSLLASAMIGILPPLTLNEAIEVTKIYSAAALNFDRGLITGRPFRTPHQTASPVAVVGGGSDPKPGEISLAHCGVLFLDELPEFQKNILESLRGPLESGVVNVARAKLTLSFPAKFTLVAAMNPCPCGYFGDDEKECRCAPFEVIRYQKKISGPLLDRIDLQIKVARVNMDDIRKKNSQDPQSPSVRQKVETARKVQLARFKAAGLHIRTNSEMSSRQVENLANLGEGTEKFLLQLDRAKLSPRSFYRLLKTARTIADLEQSETVKVPHLSEAFSYRLRES